jgi:dCMP deaminase
MPRVSLDAYYVEMLALVGRRSTCPRRQVGAIITDPVGHVLSTGYNGVPSGYPHCIDNPCPGKYEPSGDTRNCMAVHAEINAIIQCRQLERAFTLYTHTLPCFECAKVIANTPIVEIIFVEGYPDDRGQVVLTLLGKEVRQYVNVEARS